MVLAIALVLAGLVVLVFGGELLLRGAVTLATLLRLTPAVIGLTVVAAGTSVPELAVSIIATYRGSTDIAMGNVVGSNILNISLILGVAALIRPLTISGNMIKLEYPVMALATLMCVAVCADGSINRLDAILFISVYVGFTAYLVNLVRGRINASESEELSAEVKSLQVSTGAGKSVVLVLGGMLLLAGGAHLTVQGATTLAQMIGLSERVIGLTIIAVGTSLPEIVTSVVSSLRGRDDVAVANVIGSNLFNILIILGASALFTPLHVSPSIINSDNWWMLGTVLFAFPIFYTGLRITRGEGLLFLGLYGTYLTLLLMTPG